MIDSIESVLRERINYLDKRRAKLNWWIKNYTVRLKSFEQEKIEIKEQTDRIRGLIRYEKTRV